MSIFDQRSGEYVEAENGDYTKNENADSTNGEATYTYTPGAGNYKWVDNPEKEIQTVYIPNLYYKVTLNNNSWFPSYVLETGLSDNIQVISVTPAELETQIAA